MAKGNQKIGLGRGLSALLSDSGNDTRQQISHEDTYHQVKGEVSENGSVSFISLSLIEVNPFQPRKDFEEVALRELSDSIKLQGLIQPITLRRLEKDKYQLISGERRFRASKLAGLDTVPAYIRTANDQQMLEMALIENIQREDLNPIETALSFHRMIEECNLKQEELGDRVSKNRSTVTNYLRLLKLPPSIQAGVRDGKISMGHAKAIMSVEDVDKQLFLYEETLKNDLSVRKVEELSKSLQNQPNKGGKGTTTPSGSNNEKTNLQLRKIADKLTSKFGNKVDVKVQSGERGVIQIPFLSHEDLTRILEIIEP